MAIRTIHNTPDHTWFITFTCYCWLPLFETTQSYDLIYDWLRLIDEKYHIKTLAFVIMPNHVHLLLHLPVSDNLKLNTIISNGKRFMAYELIRRLTVKNENKLIGILTLACSQNEIDKGQRHKAFEPSFDAKPVYSLDFLNQKLDYIHHNPVSGKWHLCNEFTDYPHSSAAFYIDEKSHPNIIISDYREYWN
ncbi:hypothetical protein FFF34_010475 [Inquilinus sp. KBS0705]|nr:hypothetical protein FFF34_010475 [Inquilinus sp. KBS0705]